MYAGGRRSAFPDTHAHYGGGCRPVHADERGFRDTSSHGDDCPGEPHDCPADRDDYSGALPDSRGNGYSAAISDDGASAGA